MPRTTRTTRIGYTRPDTFTSYIRNADDPARRGMYFTGFHRPHALTFAPVPLFISLAQFARYKTTGDEWPTRVAPTFGCGTWALDSGAYTALDTNNPDHPWWLDADSYGGMVTRVIEEVGAPPMFVGIQDAPCEPGLLAKTGRTVEQNQEDTLDSYLYLTENFPFVPWLPTLQGWTVADYHRHADMYEAAGVDLHAAPYVGVGSVCRRDALGPVEVLTSLADRGYRLHGFGVSMPAMRVVGHRLASADSMAWSITARREQIHLDGCEHDGDCRNCLSYALVWREEMLEAIRTAARAANATPPPVEVVDQADEQLALFP